MQSGDAVCTCYVFYAVFPTLRYGHHEREQTQIKHGFINTHKLSQTVYEDKMIIELQLELK